MLLGFLDSICITVFMSLCDIVGISDRLADHDSGVEIKLNFPLAWGMSSPEKLLVPKKNH